MEQRSAASRGSPPPAPAADRQDALLEQIRRMEAVLGQIAQGVSIVDAEGRVVVVNAGFMAMYGFPAELGAPGTPLADFVRHRLSHGWRRPDEPPDADLEALVERRVRDILASGPVEFDEPLPGGRTIRVRRQRLPDGILVSTYSDVTEERRREQHAALLATAVEQSGDSVEVADADYRLLYVNPAFTRLTGWTREETVGRVSAEILRSDQHPREFYRELQKTVESGRIWKGRLISRHRDGALIHQDATISPVRDQDGRLSHFVAVKRDVGDQVRAAEALRASQERFRAIVEDQSEFILRFDPGFAITFLNRAYERHLSRPRAQLIGSSILDVMTAEQQAAFLDQVRSLTPDRPTVSYEMLLPRPDGRLGWEQWTDRAIFDERGRVVEYQSVGRDINERKQAEEALRASEVRFRTLVEDQSEFISRFTPDFRITFLNRAYARQLGRPREEIIGTSMLDLMTAAQQALFQRQLASLTPDAPTVSYEMEAQLPGGWTGLEQWTDRAIFDAGGRVIEYQSVGRDITEERRAEAELKESEERFRAIAEGVPVPVAISRSDISEMLYANQLALDIYGVPPGAGRGNILSVWVDPKDRLELVAEVGRHGRVGGREVRLRRADGTEFWALVSASALTYAGQPAILTTSADITERRRMEEALRTSEARFRAMVEDQSEFISRFTPDFRVSFVNRALADHLGRRREEIVGTSLLELMTEEQRSRFLAKLAALTPERPTATSELRNAMADGRIGWEQWTDRALFDERGQVVEYQSVGRDITEQRRAEAELRESEERFRTIAEGVPLPITIARLREPEILFVNERARETFHLQEGYAGDEVYQVWARPEDRVRLARELLQHGRVDGFEAELLRADGSSSWVLVSARVMTYRGRDAMMAAITDITDRRYMEHVVRESQARLAAFMTHAPVAMYLKNVQGRYVLANPEMGKVFARPAEQMIGLTAADTGVAHDVAYVVERDREILATGQPTVHEEHLDELDAYRWAMVIRFPVRDPSGTISHIGGFHVDITHTKQVEDLLKQSEQRFRTIAEAHPVPMVIAGLPDLDPLFANAAFEELFRLEPGEVRQTDTGRLYADPTERKKVRRLIRRSGRLDGYELVLRRSDGSLFPASLASRLITYDGRAAVVSSITDLTEKRRAEAEIARQRDALYQSEKMSALGGLLAGVAHELNNPLSIVVGQAVLLEDLSSDPATKARAAKIHAAAGRCARIVRTFLAMARSRPSERGPIDLNGMVEAALELLAYGLRSAGIAVLRDLDRDLPPVWGDGDQLHQVASNLIVNAQQALQAVDPPRELRVATRREGDLVQLEVVDNGPGVDPALAQRIFEPFFTTKPTGHGTGIGLSVCHGIVGAHGGSIELDARPGRGAAFVVRLPVSREALAAASAPGASLPGAPAGRVLMVDDEPEIGALYAEVLRRAGHEVTVAESGSEALELMRSRPFDLVVSDLRMPDMDGPALHRSLGGAAELAGRFIFITGDALSQQASRFLEETGCEVLEKPVDPDDLIARVRQRLEGG